MGVLYMNNEARVLSQAPSISLQQDFTKQIKEFGYQFIKRMFDIIIALFGLLFFLPVYLLVKIIYVSKGDFSPIFYFQTRVGLNGVPFKIYKFRTMVPNADEMLKEMLKQKKYQDEWKKFQKFDNDPRVTKVGRILRKTSLDEMPQLINMLKGELSLIGPRPLVVGELESHGGNAKIYNSVKPGVTGWWAVNGRSRMDYKKRLRLEYYYIKNKSLALDAKIFFKTFKILSTHEGAK